MDTVEKVKKGQQVGVLARLFGREKVYRSADFYKNKTLIQAMAEIANPPNVEIPLEKLKRNRMSLSSPQIVSEPKNLLI